MNRLSKEKRSQLVLVVIIIALVITGLYMGLIRRQQRAIDTIAVEKQKAHRKLDQITETSKNGPKIETELSDFKKRLERQESNMASDDLYASSINLLRNFKTAYPVEIKQFMSKGLAENTMFAKFPYKQFTVSILGSGYYHEFGKFIADFENRFQSARILNLELTPGTGTSPEDREQLVFRMDVVFLVKPSTVPQIKKP